MGSKKKEKKKTSIGVIDPDSNVGNKVEREFSAGGVVYRKMRSKVMFLITHSTPSKDYPMDVWRLPKGWIDDTNDGLLPGPISSGSKKANENDLQRTAVREVGEEGGVDADIAAKLGTEVYFLKSKVRKAKVMKFVTFYLMKYVGQRSEGHDSETSEVVWLPFEKARKRLSYSGEKKILTKAHSLLDSGIQDNLI